MRKCFREQRRRQKQQEQSHKARLPETKLLFTFNKLVQEEIKEVKLEHSGVIVTGIRQGRRM